MEKDNKKKDKKKRDRALDKVEAPRTASGGAILINLPADLPEDKKTKKKTKKKNTYG